MNLLIDMFFGAVPFLVMITILVYVHEYGHYITALKNGVKVDVFSIGFGPEVFGWNNAKGTRWKISAIPLGGYVKMADEDQQFKDNANRPSSVKLSDNSLISKTVGQKMAISFAGPLANFIYAIIVTAGLYATVGQRIPVSGAQIGQVVSGGVGDQAGLKFGDLILSFNGQAVTTPQQVVGLIKQNSHQDIDLGIQSPLNSTKQVIHIKSSLFKGTNKLGVEIKPPYQSQRHNFLLSIIYAVTDTVKILINMVAGLGDLLTGRQSASGLSGPLGIASMTGHIAQQGIVELLFLSVIISINLGLLNLFPIPVLDGGHLVLYGIEAVRGKPVPEKVQEIIFNIGFGIMMVLFAFTFWNDLQHIKLLHWVKNLF